MDQSKIGTFIMECRRERGLTQAQLAEQLHITDRAVSKWETGKSLPDSSIMLALCGILGITADELLSGARKAEPAPPPPPPPERRRPRGTGKRRRLPLLLSVGLLTGTLVCAVCDTALSGGLTWSLLVAASAVYGWALLLPAAALGRKGLAGSLGALSAFTVPYLYLLSRLLGVRRVFTLGAVLTGISVLFLWLIFAAFRRMGRTSAALGTAFLLLAGLTAAIDTALRLMNAVPSPGGWNRMAALLLLMAAAVCFFWRRGGKPA